METVVLAYSGGLDTSIAIHWLRTVRNLRVVAFTADIGQGRPLLDVSDRALEAGADAVHLEDLRTTLTDDYIVPALKANAMHEQVWYLGTALSRPCIAEWIVRLAAREGARWVAHGCTATSHDQIRLETSIAALAPDLGVVAPAREWDLAGREDRLRYAERHGIPITEPMRQAWSVDRNLWGCTIQKGPLNDLTTPPPAEAWQITVAPEDAPEEGCDVTLRFEGGVPAALDGAELEPARLIETLNDVGGRHGIGRADVIENRFVGLKARSLYEAPAATILHRAHRALEALVLTRETAAYKQQVSLKYGELVNNGLWFTQLREALDAFFEGTQQFVTGEVTLRLYKGNVTVTGRDSEFSLYPRRGLVDVRDFERSAAKGYEQLISVPVRAEARQRHRLSPEPGAGPAARPSPLRQEDDGEDDDTT